MTASPTTYTTGTALSSGTGLATYAPTISSNTGEIILDGDVTITGNITINTGTSSSSTTPDKPRIHKKIDDLDIEIEHLSPRQIQDTAMKQLLEDRYETCWKIKTAVGSMLEKEFDKEPTDLEIMETLLTDGVPIDTHYHAVKTFRKKV